MRVGTIIGRMQFMHNGHFNLIKSVLEHVDLLVVCLGSHAIAPDSRNPFSCVERVEHIKACFPNAPIAFEFIHDHPDSNQDWADEIALKVNQHQVSADAITLFGNKKEDTGWYMDLFRAKGWNIVDCGMDSKLNGTNVRDRAYCEDRYPETPTEWKSDVPEALHEVFSTWLASDTGKTRGEEHVKECLYQLPYVQLPFPPIFHTVDAMVTCQGHVLVVKRGKLRGKGLFAMPGGFLNADERLFDGAIRELIEETAIDLTPETLKEYWTGETLTLDNPNRSLIGRIVSEVFLFALPYDICGGDLPKVVGSDDAEAAIWLPIEKFKGNYYKDMDVLRMQFFEDHAYAIKSLLPICMATR